MRENRADTVLAVAFALLLHAVPLLLLLVASLLRAPPPSAAGEPISADVVDLNALSASMRSALRREPEPLAQATPPPEPQPEALDEPLPEESLPEPLEETPPEQQLQPQEQLPDPDDIDQQEVKSDSTSSDTAAREQEAKQRQAQVDLTERERQQQAEQKARTSMELERQRQLTDIRRQRAEQRRAIDLAQEKIDQIADREARRASAAAANANASPPPGNRGTEPNLSAAYTKALTDAIRNNWTQPDNVSSLQVCKIMIRQIPGGEVIDAQVDPSCPYDEQGRRSVEAAVLKAQPLPYRGFESVFSRNLTINFRAEDR
ncbi:MAG: cell envelope integrity protein TolA [Lysobacteraceae bacterium]